MGETNLMEKLNSEVNSEDESKYSIVSISGVNFGINVSDVTEIVPLPEYSRLPNVNSEIKGIFCLRGQIFSILDLRIMFGFKIKPITEQDFVVIVKSKKFSFGILVEQVMDVSIFKSNAIKKPAENMDEKIIPFLAGVTEDKKTGLINLLDIEAIINSSQLSRYRFNGN